MQKIGRFVTFQTHVVSILWLISGRLIIAWDFYICFDGLLGIPILALTGTKDATTQATICSELSLKPSTNIKI